MIKYFVAISNVLIVMIFCQFAIYFGRWWIALFSILYVVSGYYETKENKPDEKDGDNSV